MIVETKARISQSIQFQIPLLMDAEHNMILQVVRKESNINIVTNSKLLSSFSDEENLLITSNAMESVLGLSYFLGVEDHKLQSAKVKGIKELKSGILASEEDEMIKILSYVLYEALLLNANFQMV